MNKAIKYVVAGGIGAAAGVLGSSVYWKKRIKKDTDEAREYLRQYFEECYKTAAEPKTKAEDTPAEEKKEPPAPVDISPKKEVDNDAPAFFVIAPFEYRNDPECENYDCVSYHYYPDDDIFVNADTDIAVDDTEVYDLVGRDVVDHFGEYEDDAVYIRNDKEKAWIAVYLKEGAYQLE